MRYGQTEEEIFVNLVEATDYNFFEDSHELYKIYKDNSMAAFHYVNLNKKFPITISYDELRNAFTDEFGLQNLINAKLDVIESSVNNLEYEMTKLLLSKSYDNGLVYSVKVDEPTNESTSKSFLATVKEYIGQMRFIHPEYNIAGATSTSLGNDVVFITTPKYSSIVSVEALAYAFNLDKADINISEFIVDKFNNSNVIGFLCDRRFIKIREQLRQMATFYAGNTLRWNYFYHLWEMFSISPFFPCIALTKDNVNIDSINISSSTSFTNGSEVKIIAKAMSEDGGYVPQIMDYEITSNVTSNYTYIVPGTNLLHVGDDETAKSISIKITSRYDNTVSATHTLTSGDE